MRCWIEDAMSLSTGEIDESFGMLVIKFVSISASFWEMSYNGASINLFDERNVVLRTLFFQIVNVPYGKHTHTVSKYTKRWMGLNFPPVTTEKASSNNNLICMHRLFLLCCWLTWNNDVAIMEAIAPQFESYHVSILHASNQVIAVRCSHLW